MPCPTLCGSFRKGSVFPLVDRGNLAFARSMENMVKNTVTVHKRATRLFCRQHPPRIEKQILGPAHNDQRAGKSHRRIYPHNVP